MAESVAISGARWVVDKALSPLSDGLVEAWAASSELAPNIEALKMELLYAQAMLNNARGREIHNPALTELLQKLRGLAYGAEDALDELDYFRIQDELEGTFETVDRGCIHNLSRDARNTTKAAVKQLECTSCFSASKPEDGGGARSRLLCGAWPCGDADEDSCKCARRLTSRARSTVQAVGKRLLCSSLLPAHDSDGQHSNMPRNGKRNICGACSFTCMAPRKKQPPKTPKLDFDRVDVSRRMRHIVEQLQPICAKVSTILDLELLGSAIELLGSRGSNIGSVATTSRSITTSGSSEPKLYGRDLEKNTMVENITTGSYLCKDLTVLPIVGPGGIGKTTLTQYVYNSKEVQEHFPITVWVCVSLDFSVYRLTQEIANSIPKAEDENNDRADGQLQNLDQLQKLIEKRLKNKRFLLVLDDIWKYGHENEWKRLLVPFRKGQVMGNIILATTRFLEVAETITTSNKVIQLDGLSPVDFWSFFMECVFGHGESKKQLEDGDLKCIGEQIVEKLKGSPLAAKTVGRLLRNNPTPDHWTRVLESKEWESQITDHDIMPALKLSYDYLPFHLQQCFSYCALFPEDYQFNSEELIRFWIGLDILRPDHPSKIIEDIGLNYLSDLVSYGFFKKEIDEVGTHYVMHDLLHDLALKVSSHECLLIDSSIATPIEILPSIYHLSIIMSSTNSEDGTNEANFRKQLAKVKNIVKSENLHTLMIFGQYDERFIVTFSELFKDAKSLRIVRLSTMSHPVESILHNFSKLVHLRYVKLQSNYGDEIHLPTNLSRLYHLRVLDIEEWRGTQNFPMDIANLSKLRHFLVPFYTDDPHCNISNVGKLCCLQELKRFQVKKESTGFELRELGQLAELGGSLRICSLENAQVNEAHEAKLLHKNRLQKLTLDWGKGRSTKDPYKEDNVIEGLRPHSNLHELGIVGHGGPTCPTWLGTNFSIKALEALHLDGVAWKVLPPLGELWLIDDSGGEYFGSITGQSFRNLKRLEFIGLPNLRKWVAEEVCPMFFSFLEVLVVSGCDELTELPFSYYNCYPSEGDRKATCFPRLRKCNIGSCPKLLSLPPIPYTQTLSNVDISAVGTGLERLHYSNMAFKSLIIKGNEALHSLDETVLAFHNLTQLQRLNITNFLHLAGEHLQMLTSLKELSIDGSNNLFSSFERSDVKWQLPVEHLTISNCHVSGKEMAQLLSHLPNLSMLIIESCHKITRLCVVVQQQQQQQMAAVTLLEDTQATDQHQQMAESVEKDEIVIELIMEQQWEEEEDEGWLLFPAHLSDSLRELEIWNCSELILVAPPLPLPLPLPDGHKSGIGGLQPLCSLQKLKILGCPILLSDYKTSSSSSCCPFPSSLQQLTLTGRIEGMETLEPLSTFSSLTELKIIDCGEDFRCKGLWHLLTRGQLSELRVYDNPRFFDGWDPIPMLGRLQDEQEQLLLLQCSSKLRDLRTDDFAGVLVKPICSVLSSSLTNLALGWNNEVECFTKEQEEALRLLTSLQDLQFWFYDKLQRLPAGLHMLTSLTRLEIWYCPAIQSLPKDGLPSALQELKISSCPAIRSLPKGGLPSSLQVLDVSYGNNEELKQQCRKLLGTIPTIKL